MKRSLFFIALLLVLCGCMNDYPNEKVNSNLDSIVEKFDDATLSESGYLLGYATENLMFEYFMDETYGYWGGFAVASHFDMEDGSSLNQYSVYNSVAASGDKYLLYYYDDYNEPCDILCRYYGYYQFASVCMNLSTFTYKSITDEDANAFARTFTDGDYLKVIFTALMENKTEGKSVECYVVDYRDGKRYVATNWDAFDISGLCGEIWGLRVRIETSDVGEWGANTPLYICMDNLVYTCER